MSSIGSWRSHAIGLFQNFGLAPFRSLLSPDAFVRAAHGGGCAPQRARPLIPEVVAWLMMYVGLHAVSMTQGLAQAWGLIGALCPGLRKPCISEEAFCQARNQLSLGFWRALWEHLVAAFEARFKTSLLWKGFWRVLAIDGSDIDLPNVPALVRFFGKPGAVGGNARRPQAKLVALCSVFTGFCSAFKLLPKRFSEHAAVAHLLRRLRARDLVLMDKGFFSYSTLHRLPKRGAGFLLRLPESAVRFAHRLEALGPNDWRVEFRPSSVCRRKDPDLPPTLTARLIQYQISGFRPSHLLTSLPETQAAATELVDLYHRRWQIETIYREWKHALDIQNLRSHTPAGIYKEAYAQLLLSNLVRWTMTEAVQGTDLHATDLSYLCALTAVKNSLLHMLQARPRQIRSLYDLLLDQIRSARIRKRPGRSYPRPYDSPQNKGNGKVSRPARLPAP